MTTSEFIIGHSVDDATEKKAEVRKILWALLAAVFLHLLIGYGIATFSGVFSSSIQVEEDKPVELTIVDLSTPPPAVAKKNSMFMETDESKASAEPPKEKTFESNANAIAASQQPATGDAPLPSQEGKNRPSVDLENHNYSLANQGAQPQPSAAPQETPRPSEAPKLEATPTPAIDQLAMLTSTPTATPIPRPSVTPQQQASSYQAYKQQTRLSGRITNRGIASVNALGTPLGRYQKYLFDAIGSRWYAYLERPMGIVNIGTARLVFWIDRSGRIKNLKVIDNTSNETFANICIASVQEAHVPAMPDDLAATMPSEGLEVEIPFTIFANQ
ncbi:MAG: hypothetical protein M3R29_05185 [Verrucomicrobiota bacterium]|nr:hypothetical protein [Verrucomicrobiota bacterium]